ncbi:hypothetical protein GGI21_001895 [Coemansia aciculifera]|nr:hypothetical protein GGI21_001895 [Coemansia aciculifera]
MEDLYNFVVRHNTLNYEPIDNEFLINSEEKFRSVIESNPRLVIVLRPANNPGWESYKSNLTEAFADLDPDEHYVFYLAEPGVCNNDENKGGYVTFHDRVHHGGNIEDYKPPAICV